MKNKLFYLGLIFLSLFFKAQVHDNIIEYDYIYNSFGSEPIVEKKYLIFNENESVFFSYKKDKANLVNIKKNYNYKNSLEAILHNKVNNYYQIYSNKIFSKDPVFTKDDFNNISWNIFKENKTILNYLCQKATCSYRGRNYIAWFTKEIPKNIGPLKFGGLPGLILEIQDTEKIFTYEANQIILNSSFNLDVFENIFSNDVKYISFKEFVEIQNKHMEDFKARIAASRPVGQVPINTSGLRDYLIEKSFEWDVSAKP